MSRQLRLGGAGLLAALLAACGGGTSDNPKTAAFLAQTMSGNAADVASCPAWVATQIYVKDKLRDLQRPDLGGQMVDPE